MMIKSSDQDNFWLHISDMMSGLMMIFLFISISYMLQVFYEKNKIQDIALTYQRVQKTLYDSLYNEFKYDLKKWDAEIDDKTLSVRFKSPDILFKTGSDLLEPRFIEILNDFFPRYVDVLIDEQFRNEIEEIRIEGHTSSEWSENVLEDIAYFKNMKLSQDRTRRVLEFVISLENIKNHKEWIKKLITANGLSSSKLIKINGIENKEKSRRVEFRIRAKAEEKILKIIEGSF